MDSRKLTLGLKEAFNEEASLLGAKSKNLAFVVSRGFNVPEGLCLTTEAYDLFLEENQLREQIFAEIHRKPLRKMRWEEMWDTSLRIRSLFLQGTFPPKLRELLSREVSDEGLKNGVSVRSSSQKEDHRLASYAGVHETLLKINSRSELEKAIKIVWASLWSDVTLLYKKELSLNIERSKMGVLIQKMVYPTCSGVCFSESPIKENSNDRKNICLVEVVPGECRNLVDGILEPKQILIEKENLDQVSDFELLSSGEIKHLGEITNSLEELFGHPVDIEWCKGDGVLFVLQVRPITSGGLFKKDREKFWFIKLRPKKEHLWDLAKKVESELIPKIKERGEQLSREELDRLGPGELQKCLIQRHEELKDWQEIYKNDFIPFAHGVRQLGQYYNDHVSPEDPFEFTGLLKFEDLEATKRNNSLLKLTIHLNKSPSLKEVLLEILKENQSVSEFKRVHLKKILKNEQGKAFLRSYFKVQKKYLDVVFDFSRLIERNDLLGKHLLNLVEALDGTKEMVKSEGALDLESKLYNAVGKDREDEAREIIKLGRLSWKIRDDDNLFLSKIEAQLLRVIKLGLDFLNLEIDVELGTTPIEKLVEGLSLALLDPDHRGPFKEELQKINGEAELKKKKKSVQAFQLIGQPAAPGIISGEVKIVLSVEDLGKFKAGDILVCKAIQPQMTHLLPLASAIIEQRGGMLIHGALLAREFCIPCVNGIPEIFEQVKDGDFVTVDGHLGLVTIGTPDI